MIVEKIVAATWSWPGEGDDEPRRKGDNRLPEAKQEHGRLLRRARRERRDTDALLTAREDALRIRKAVLDGDRRAALAEADWLVDAIDEYLSEG